MGKHYCGQEEGLGFSRQFFWNREPGRHCGIVKTDKQRERNRTVRKRNRKGLEHFACFPFGFCLPGPSPLPDAVSIIYRASTGQLESTFNRAFRLAD